MRLGRGARLAGGTILLAMIVAVVALAGPFDLAGQSVQPAGGGPAALGGANSGGNPTQPAQPPRVRAGPAEETPQTSAPAQAAGHQGQPAQRTPDGSPPQPLSDSQTGAPAPDLYGGQAETGQDLNLSQGNDVGDRPLPGWSAPPPPPDPDLWMLEYLAPFLQILVAAALGAAAGYGLALVPIGRISRRLAQLDKVLEGLDEDVSQLDDELSELNSKRESGKAGAGSRQQGAGAHREAGLAAQTAMASASLSSASADRGHTRAAPAQARVGEPADDGVMSPAADSGEAWILRAYRELLASGIPKRREIDAKFDGFSNMFGLQMTDAGKILVGRYTGGDPSELLMALGNGGELLVVPSYEYLSTFGRAFKASSENPPLITHYFALDIDGSGHPKLIQPAHARIDDAGQIQLTRPGRLAGFVR